MTSLRAQVLVLAIFAVGCATGVTPGRRDAGGGGDVDAMGARDGGALDAGAIDGGGGGVDASAPTDDAAITADASSPDASPPRDGGPIGPITCTAATAGAVCGGRPCVDGYCCDDPCVGACRSCRVPGSEGTCSLHGTGSDPDSECADEAAATCGTSGVCNGAGACAFHPTSVTCDDGMTCTAGDACDGAGTCRGAAPSMCAPVAGNECCLGSCTAGGGCRTDPGVCADRCDANQLAIGRSCLGCGAARAAGACMGGGLHTCDAASHSLCQQLTCGGVMYRCTNDGGTWQWRTATRCDDSNACTHGDTCAAGACGGTAVTCTSTTCMTRACNGTATCTDTPRPGMTCDDGDLCSYNDTCSAAGTCGSASRVTCTNSACIDRVCNGTAACTQTIRSGSTCDDAVACTHGETCSAAGVCGTGTTIACDPMDTVCRDFSCNGTMTCASAPRTGTVCDDGVAATTGDVCRSDGTCMGTVGCPLPVDACATGIQNRDRCTGARVIGRSVARNAAGYVVTGDTCSASNRFDDCSWDAGNDHAYRIWLRMGEVVSIQLSRTDTCFSSWAATLKIYESTGCSDVTCGTDVWCEDFVSSAARNYTAVRDGWIVIVVDGSTAFDDEGQYTLTVRLTTCRTPGCEC